MEQIICLRNGRRYWYTFGKQHTVHTCMYKQEIGENKGKWSVLQAMTEYISLLNSLLSYYICCIQSKQLNLKLKKPKRIGRTGGTIIDIFLQFFSICRTICFGHFTQCLPSFAEKANLIVRHGFQEAWKYTECRGKPKFKQYTTFHEHTYLCQYLSPLMGLLLVRNHTWEG